jgi:hypothetical protein
MAMVVFRPGTPADDHCHSIRKIVDTMGHHSGTSPFLWQVSCKAEDK